MIQRCEPKSASPCAPRLIYNLPMAGTYRALLYLPLTLVPFISRAQEPKVAIVPRPQLERPASGSGDATFQLRVDTSLVLIPVQATSSSGATINDLLATNFRVFEDGAEQRIIYFSKDDAPVSIGLVFDSSASMTNKMRRSAEAAAAFFQTANREDEFFLVGFGERPKLKVPFTTDPASVYRTLVHSRAFGRTSLFDAIHLALMQMKNARNSRKALVILSDGGDNRSRFTRSEIKDEVLESDVQMHAMGIFDRDMTKHTTEEENGPRLLNELAEQTGGRLYPVEDMNDLKAISLSLGNALRNQYVLGYLASNSARDGKYRRVRVDLAGLPATSAIRLSHRRGYYAPPR